MTSLNLDETADMALQLMQTQGFSQAQVNVSCHEQDEVNIAHNEPSLLRSTESHVLALAGIVDACKASAETSDLRSDNIKRLVAELFDSAQAAPPDEANVVSALERVAIEQGPQYGDLDLLADKVSELLELRAAETPKMVLEEGFAAHQISRSRVLTSAGSALSSSVGWYSLTASGTAKEGTDTSSINYAGGDCHDLAAQHAADWFGIADMMRETERQIHTGGFDRKFVGEVVLSPHAVRDVLAWLQAQLSDTHLIAGSSLYRDCVGETIASPLLSVRSRFDAPGVTAITGDAFVAQPIHLISEGRLAKLLPSLYASRKTGFAHTPARTDGWKLAAGAHARGQLIADVTKGALVGRLSMGSPAANGDFSGVIKNSFRIDAGETGTALAETMVTGNMAHMLRDIVAVSRERLDTGSLCLPWIRIANLHFS